jgi:hypothetical protein
MKDKRKAIVTTGSIFLTNQRSQKRSSWDRLQTMLTFVVFEACVFFSPSKFFSGFGCFFVSLSRTLLVFSHQFNKYIGGLCEWPPRKTKRRFLSPNSPKNAWYLALLLRLSDLFAFPSRVHHH